MLEIIIPEKQMIVMKSKDGKELFCEESTTLSCIIDDAQAKSRDNTEMFYRIVKDELEKRYNCKGELTMDSVYILFVEVRNVMESLKKTT